MQYVPEIQSFYERLESTPLSVYAIALWHALMHMNHKQGWSKEFKVASAALCFKSGLKVDMLTEARQELVQKGLLHYEDTDDGLAATYILWPLTDPADGPEENIESLGNENTKDTEIIGKTANTWEIENIENTENTGNTVNNGVQNVTKAISDHAVNGEYTLNANLKRLDIHDKMLKKEWQQSVNIALTDMDVEDGTLQGLQRYRPGDPVSIVVKPWPPSQTEGAGKAQQKTDKSNTRPSANRTKKLRKNQAKRKAHARARDRDQAEEIESMGPFESPPTGKEKVLQTFTF